VWDFVIATDGSAVAFDNSASVEGTPPFGTFVVDVSDDGDDVDANDNGNAGDPDEDTPTPATIPALAALGDTVFEDTNANGIQDPGEPGVPGVVVTLLDEEGSPTGQTDLTDADGIYGFDELDPGTYIVEFTEPAGRDFTPQDAGDDEAADSDADPATGQTDPVTLAAGDNNEDVDAGLTPPPSPVGSISDTVFDDLDGDGIQDPDEPGIAGVTVRLLDEDGNAVVGVEPTTTGDDGTYIFANLPAGDYIVEFVAPDGRVFSPANEGDDEAADSDAGPDGRTDVITLAAGDNNRDVDAGIAPVPDREFPAIGLAKSLSAGPVEGADGVFTLTYTFVIENLGDVALSDVGIADDFEAVFAGATVESGPTPAGGDCSAEAATNSASLSVGESCTAVWEIEVSGITPGETYDNTAIATGTSPEGEEVSDTSDDNTGVDPADVETDPDGDGNADEPGENDPTPVTFPAAPNQAVIGDKVFIDANGNGIQDPGEAPVQGVTVEIRKTDGTGLIEVTTDEDGLWSAMVDPGEYDITFIPPAGFIFSPQNAGDDTEADSNVDPSGETGTITVADGEINNSIDAGLVPLGTVGNRVFNDANNNGIRDPGEQPIQGATVQLFVANADGTKGAVVDTIVTGADGNYLFDEVLSGSYIVVVTPPAGFRIGAQDAGTDDTVDSDISPVTGESAVITVGIGQEVTDVDAGLVQDPTTPVNPGGPQLQSPTITNAPGPVAAPAPSPVPSTPPLAVTGSSSNVLATLAIAMMAVGGTLLIGARRERDQD